MTYAEAHAPMASDVKVMSWPARTCSDCQHADCVRRRKERHLPCAVCEKPIRGGQTYRELVRVNGDLVAVCHEACREAEAHRV